MAFRRGFKAEANRIALRIRQHLVIGALALGEVDERNREIGADGFADHAQPVILAVYLDQCLVADRLRMLLDVESFLQPLRLEHEHVEGFRSDYAETLRHWRERFTARSEEVKALYDERFFRMWEYYLAASETAFRQLGMNNFQIQMSHHQHVLPVTRHYIGEEEERLRAIDSRRPRIRSVPAE